MYKSKVLVGCVLLVYVLFVFFEFKGDDSIAYVLDCLITPLIALIYLFFVKKKGFFFVLFILFYSISDLLGVVVSYFPENEEIDFKRIDYFVGNLMFILAYIFLVIKISKSLNLFYVFKNFKIHLIVLTILNVYLVYVLQIILYSSLSNMPHEYYTEMAYNIVMLLLLSIALLNYFYRDNKKSFYLFIGALCIVFSEVMQVAYFYIAHRSLLNFISTTLTLAAFYFFYQQSKLLNDLNEDKKYMAVE
ncbi:hypothetical protein [Flavivirga jejuensis]|uniref:YhhN-like protein n=1 Tax=Flavivirga jejuensis TaxID=870487 RepID=A0ABT8WNY5_9FLAO|nr:hypothetical protein [Flavivirga jejuensis]MDO5974883.1 hypothetical protein [Flavivirga jejuensis]